VLFDNRRPRYLPHIAHPDVLLMGLTPLRNQPWIETDNDLQRYYRHKLEQRRLHAERVYRATADSLPAQAELARMLQQHLLQDQADQFRAAAGRLHCADGAYSVALDSPEPLWTCSLWVADDLVLMQEQAGQYVLTAASLCSPSHWRLEEKFGRPMREIHDPIPGFHRELTPRIDRFFRHLRPEYPVVRFNWSLQEYDALDQRPEHAREISAATLLYYRSERQSLVRLPETGAIAFTIRVYIHPLAMLAAVPEALPTLFAAIENTAPALARYKAFDALAPALEKYRP
jgi:hypothetical protein